MYVVVSGILIPYIRCVPLKSFMKNVLRKRVEENRWTSLGYLMTFPSFHLKVKMQQFWKSEPSKFQQVQHIHQEYLNLWLIVSPHWLCLRMWKKINWSFSYLRDFYKVSSLVSLVLQKYECRLNVFPLRWATSWISAWSGRHFHRRWRNFISAQL